jgi:hypothetical protein
MDGKGGTELLRDWKIGKTTHNNHHSFSAAPYSLSIDGGVSRKWTLLGRLETASKPRGLTRFDFLVLSLMLVDSSCATLVQSGSATDDLLSRSGVLHNKTDRFRQRSTSGVRW